MIAEIKDFPSYYIDEYGYIYSGEIGGSTRIDTKGYEIIDLNKDGKRYTKRVHRLVAEAFLPNPLNLPVVNHIDSNRLNNCVDNLEWVSYTDNNRHAVIHGNHNMSKRVIQIEDNIVYFSVREASRATGISRKRITTCCNGKREEAGGFRWEYLTE